MRTISRKRFLLALILWLPFSNKYVGRLAYKSDCLKPRPEIKRQFLFDVIEQRHQVASTIMCSQLPVSDWHTIIGEGTIADAILDRMIYSSHRIEIAVIRFEKKQRLKQ